MAPTCDAVLLVTVYFNAFRLVLSPLENATFLVFFSFSSQIFELFHFATVILHDIPSDYNLYLRIYHFKRIFMVTKITFSRFIFDF